MLSNLVDRANAGMIQSRRGPGFAAKPLQRVSVGNYFLRKKFEGYEASEFKILGLVNDAHATAAQLFDDPIMRDVLLNHENSNFRWAYVMGLPDRSQSLPRWTGAASTGTFGEELAHRDSDLFDVGFQCEMPGIQELDGGVGIVSFEGLCAGGDEERIVLAPNCQQRRL